jgi:hypothetical protein
VQVLLTEYYKNSEVNHVKESAQDFGGKARKKETTLKTKAYMGGWDQNGS